jgi:hypothetical protein
VFFFSTKHATCPVHIQLTDTFSVYLHCNLNTWFSVNTHILSLRLECTTPRLGFPYRRLLWCSFVPPWILKDNIRKQIRDAQFQTFILIIHNRPIIRCYVTFTVKYTVCPTRYRTRHFFNNSTVSQQWGAVQTHTADTHYRHTLQTHTENTFLFISHTTNALLFKFRCNIFIDVRIIKEMLGSVASGTPCIIK